MAASTSATQSNKFVWNDYKAPRWPLDAEEDDACSVDPAEPQLMPGVLLSKEHSPIKHENSHCFALRHLKQGATGAVKTWPVAEVMLDYLVRYGGLLLKKQDVKADDDSVLDLTCAPPDPDKLLEIMQCDQPVCYNVLELGAGTGYLGIGLALSLNAKAVLPTRARILCTDMDKNTIKNMRHNLTARQLNKTVRVESLCWGEESISDPKFLQAVQSLFRSKKKPTTTTNLKTSPKSVVPCTPADTTTHADNDDPICLLTHLIGSDVHYGETTLEPLSSVIAAVKLRNPPVQVILLMKERSPNAIAQLQSRIEDKVRLGLEKEAKLALCGFSVRVRDVLHEQLSSMKILEC